MRPVLSALRWHQAPPFVLPVQHLEGIAEHLCACRSLSENEKTNSGREKENLLYLHPVECL